MLYLNSHTLSCSSSCIDWIIMARAPLGLHGCRVCRCKTDRESCNLSVYLRDESGSLTSAAFLSMGHRHKLY